MTISKTVKKVSKLAETLYKNCDQNITHNGHVYAFRCRVEAAGDVISGTTFM